MIISDNATLIEHGATPVFVTGHWHVFRDTTGQGDYDTSRVDVAQMDRAAEGVEDNGEPFLLDIEVFDHDVDAMVTNVRLALLRWKSAKPSRPIGVYRLVPKRDFWTPANEYRYHAGESSTQSWRENDEQFALWQSHNDRVAEALVPLVDFVCPSVYALDPRYERYWLAYADANIREAARVADGTPVWPIIQPIYPGGQPISMRHWRKMVEHVANHPDTNEIVVYCPAAYQPAEGWDRPVLELMEAQPDMPTVLDAEPSDI